MDNQTKIALVTGASSGIGEALTRELASQDWLVIGIARSSDKLSSIKNDLQERFMPFTCDLSKKENIAEVSKHLLDQNLVPSLFFLNAGMTGDLMIENPERFDLRVHEKFMQTGYFGVLGWLEHWEKPCLERGGANFIVTSSLNAVLPVPNRSAYCASKAAISKAFESLSMTYAKTSLQFSVVYPGPVYTNGIRGKYPFTWTKEKLAKCMVSFALTKKTRCEPSFIYGLSVRLLRLLPESLVIKIFDWMH